MEKSLPKTVMIKSLMVILFLGLSVNAMAQNITLNRSNENLKNVIEEISKQAKTEFMYNDELIAQYKVTVNFNKTPFAEAMSALFKNLPLKYSTKNGVVIISPEPKKGSVKPSDEFTLNGKVISKDDKTTVPGATLSIEGTSTGTIIGWDGLFSIKVKPGDVIVVSHVGMKNIRYIVAKGGNNIVFEMITDNINVGDVVVTGYGNIKANQSVGATTTIKASDLNKSPLSNIQQMLQGKIAGVVVTNNSGEVGARQKTKVRGTSTLLGNQEPVWVVDGMIQEDPIPFKATELNAFGSINQGNMDLIRNFVGNAVSWLNPNDIEDITVLKDAAATAIYGVKAANGVIVIRTKRGKEGKISVSYSGGIAVNGVTNYDKLNLMNSKERIDVSREIIQNGYLSTRDLADIGYEGLYKKYMNRQISYDEFNLGVKKLETTNTDWLDILMRVGVSNNHAISISGGSDRIQYYSSLSANFAKGQSKDNQSNTYGANVSINAWIIPDKLSIDTRLSASMAKTEASYGANAYDYAIKTSRAIGAYNEDGTRSFYPKSGTNTDYKYNFMNESENSSNINNTNSFNGATSINWRISDLFRFTTSLGYAMSSVNGTSYLSERTYAMTSIRGYEFGTQIPSDIGYKSSMLPNGGELNTANNTNFNYTFRTQLDFNKIIKTDHRVSASLGYEMRSTKYTGYDETLYGYFPNRGKSISLPPQTIYEFSGDGTSKNVRNALYDHFVNRITDRISNYMSIYLAAGYSYKEKYIVSANVRSDASNRFGQDKNAAFLPVFSVGGRWNVEKEDWMLNQTVFNSLSLRASYGWQGNVAENYGPDLIASINPTPDRLTGENVLNIRSLPYNDLRWEKVKTYNVGLDMGFAGNRLQLSLNYYYKKTDDMIVELQVPLEFGVEYMPINGGSMTNSGWDLTIMATPIRTNNFTWNISLNTAKNNNNIQSKLMPKKDWRTAVSGTLNQEGYAYSSFWGFEYLGVDGKNGAPLIKTADKTDPNYDKNDATTWMKYLGKMEPDFSGGISTSFIYKSLSLSASFNLNIGASRFLTNYVSNYYNLPAAHENMSKEFVNRWKVPGDENRVGVKPGILTNENNDHMAFSDNQSGYKYEAYNYSDDRVVNANFFRCNIIALNYTIPDRFLNRSGIKSLSIGASMSNPFIIVSKDYKGIDPEVATGSSPIMKSYNFSLNLTF